MSKVLELKDIRKYFAEKRFLFFNPGKVIKAVDGVSFSVNKGETFGLVGESGCGKTTIAKIVAGIITPDSGRVTFKGKCDMVFQDPLGSLNPRMNIFDIVTEPLFVRGCKKNLIVRRYEEITAMVRMSGKDIKEKFPHQFSGGQRQRIAIARAIISEPELLLLDEAVSSLDVSVQAGILNLLKDLQRETGISYLFISHDLRVVEFMSDTVGIMKDGKLVEIASKYEIYNNPGSDYTKDLLTCIPEI